MARRETRKLQTILVTSRFRTCTPISSLLCRLTSYSCLPANCHAIEQRHKTAARRDRVFGVNIFAAPSQGINAGGSSCRLARAILRAPAGNGIKDAKTKNLVVRRFGSD